MGKRSQAWISGIGIGAFLAGTAMPALAQQSGSVQTTAEAGESSEDGGVTVTARRLGAGKARATFELDRADIADRPLGADVTQSLAKVPGVKISTGDARGGSFSFELFVRGLNKEQVGLTLDGIPTGDARFNGGSPPQRFIDSSNIGSIVVSQSAGDIGAPSRFALGGFIDFRTDDPAKDAAITAEGGVGTDNYTREYVRIDTGNLPGGFAMYGSYSHQYNDIWAGPKARRSYRDHGEFKAVKTFAGGSFLKARAAYNSQFDNDFNLVTLPQFRANPRGDNLNDTLTGITSQDLNYGGTFGGARRDFLGYLNGRLIAGEQVTISVNPYYQTLDGYSTSYQNRHRQLAGGDPAAVLGYNATGGAIRPALATTSNPNVFGGPADMRVTPRTRERYGTTAEIAVRDLLPRNSFRMGLWYDGGTSTETRNFFPILPSTKQLAWKEGRPSYVLYDRWTSITTVELYGQDSIEIIPEVLRLDAGLTWYTIRYKARSPLEYAARLNFRQNAPVQPKLALSLKPAAHVEIFGGYARNFSGIPEDAFLGSTAVIQPKDLKPLQSINLDAGLRYTTAHYAFSVQGYHVHLKNGVGIVPNDPTVTDPIDIQRGNVATRAATILGQTTDGLELSGLATYPWIDLYATYSYQRARYDDAVVGSRDRLNLASVGIIAGSDVRDIPRHSVYGELGLKPLAGVRLQGNVRYVSSRVGGDIIAPTSFSEVGIERIPGYALFGLSARYTLPPLGALRESMVQLNVDNLFDKRYIGSVSSATATAAETGLPGRSLGRYFLGAPRSVTASFRMKF
ncbi:TonB-dependent receptor [Sphingomonas sp.]|uniref:TonB-dependent receptor n=1 Tax=Sphingomonas sp. TaxID=28214 RepID=UPI002FD9CCFC